MLFEEKKLFSPKHIIPKFSVIFENVFLPEPQNFVFYSQQGTEREIYDINKVLFMLTYVRFIFPLSLP